LLRRLHSSVVERLAGGRPAVLVVDDDHDAAEALAELLMDEGYDVALAGDGRQALNKLACGPLPDVILLDLMMPQVSGYEFRALQLADPRLAVIPTIALTAGAIDERVDELRVDDCVRKPAPIEMLLEVIGRQLRVKGRPPKHFVHFYDHEDALVEQVGAFLADGLLHGEAALVVATGPHAQRFRAFLARRELDIASMESRGQLRVLDARAALAQVMLEGRIHRETFAAAIGTTLDRLEAAAPRGRVRVFGEMVDLLWRGGDASGALALESCWNHLGELRRFSLLCAYFSDGTDADPRLHEGVLERHSAVV
jgi:CheY-like chemotaxis protein